VEDTARIEAQLGQSAIVIGLLLTIPTACVYAVAGFRERIIDNAILAACADVDAGTSLGHYIPNYCPRPATQLSSL
jgi:hypothetical protein